MALDRKTFGELSAHPRVAVGLGKQINLQINNVSRPTRDALRAAMGKAGQEKIISTRKDKAYSDLVKLQEKVKTLPPNAKTDFKENVVDSLNPVHRSGLTHIDVSPSLNDMRSQLEENPAAPAATASAPAPAAAPAATPPPPSNSGNSSSPEKEGMVNWVKAHPVKSATLGTVGLGVLGSGVLANAGPLAATSYNTVMNTPVLGGLAHSVINGGSIILNGAGNMVSTLATNIPVLKTIIPAIVSSTTNVVNYTRLNALLPGPAAPIAVGFLGLAGLGKLRRMRNERNGVANPTYNNKVSRFIGKNIIEGIQMGGFLATYPIRYAGRKLKTAGKFTKKQLAKVKPNLYNLSGAGIGAFASALIAPAIPVAPFISGTIGYAIGNYLARKNKGGSESSSEGNRRSRGEGGDGDGDED